MDACPGHVWRETGRVGSFLKGGVPDIFKHGLPNNLVFVRCTVCRQNGWKRWSGAKVVFTWCKEPDQWLCSAS